MQEHFLKNMDNKSYDKQRKIASSSYPLRSLNKAGLLEQSMEYGAWLRLCPIFM